MVEKKKKSRRLTTRKRVAIMKRITATNAKLRRAEHKKQKQQRVPPSVLRTDEENKTYEDIKNNAKIRNMMHVEKMKNSEKPKAHMEKVYKLYENNNTIVEILDARDPVGSRNMDVEEIIVSGGKKLVIILSWIDKVPINVVDAWKQWLRGQNLTVFDVNEFDWVETGMKIGIFGNDNVGKHTFYKNLKQHVASKGYFSEDIYVDPFTATVPVTTLDLFSIMRKKQNLNKIELANFLGCFVKSLDLDLLALLCEIPVLNTVEEICLALVEKHGKIGSRNNVDLEEGAKILLNYVFEYKIKFWREPNAFIGQQIDAIVTKIEIPSE